ncbi:hypothetical protein HOY80DRAFT_1037254 [Tuber brumale]|nr:hypothetical protein HOY80DRAFT_1037254 [Tuber brumale]
MDLYTKNMDLKGQFTLLGAIERILFQAQVERRIPKLVGDCTQVGINEIAQLGEFIIILANEVKERGLVLKDVQSCIKDLAREVLFTPHPHTSRRAIVIKKTQHDPNYYAALVVFMKVQDEWLLPLSWREDK